MSLSKKIVITGVRNTGDLHLGNYFGAILPLLKEQTNSISESICFIADLHGLNTIKEKNTLRNNSLEVARTWIALGLDYEKITFFKQSDVKEHTELTWILSCITGMGLLNKCHAYKEAIENGRDANSGLFMYPVLMAADILLYNTDFVPVGKDQKQHVEVARDIALSFNAVYGDVFKLPTPVIDEKVMLIPGIDGRKMSKSYHNTIPIFTDAKNLKKIIYSITTDSSALEDSKDLDSSLIGILYKLVANENEYNDLKNSLKDGKSGWGHAKNFLIESITSYFKNQYEVYNDLKQNEEKLEEILFLGAEKARKKAQATMTKVKEAIGF